MTKEQALAIPEVMTLGKAFADSGLFKDIKSQAQAVVKILAGRELGLGPVYSMTHIYVVQDRIAIGAEVMGAVIKRSGRYDYAVKTLTDIECRLSFTDGGQAVFESIFTMEDARRAGLLKSQGSWEKWPRAMLMSKALSQGARIVCPHIISGAYTGADMGLEETEEGNIVEGEIIEKLPPQPPKEKQPASQEKVEEVKKKTSASIEPTAAASPTPQFANLGEFYKKAHENSIWGNPSPSRILVALGLKASELTLDKLPGAWAKLEELWEK